MPNRQITVAISAGQSRNPEKRSLEQQVASLAAEVDGVGVLQLPHLYDLAPKGPSFDVLRSVDGDLILFSWLYDRAAHWVLDRNQVRGQPGEVELLLEQAEDEEPAVETAEEQRVIDDQPRPQRKIYCIDLRASTNAQEFVDEIIRIQSLADDPRGSASDHPDQGPNRPTTDASPNQATGLTLEMLQRHERPTNDTYLGQDANGSSTGATLFGAESLVSIDEHPSRRWYPVIDFSRCTNCMECIDFCLFGVYGVDALETIIVEQADNCRKGCPACSRVCPQNAIIFPQHKTPAIAGAPIDSGGLKIDLSKLFGAPEADEDAQTVAARERDEQLILAGREAVGKDSVLGERLAAKQNQPADDLDNLLDELDSLDL